MNQIEVSPGGVQALSTNIQNLSTEINSAEESMAIVVNGDTAPKAISKGQYLFIKNHSTLATGGYHATAAIASGANVAGKVSADQDGIVNKLNETVAALDLTAFRRVASISFASGTTKTIELNNFVNYIVSVARSGLSTTLVYLVSSAAILNKLYDNADFTVSISGGILTITNNCGYATNLTVMPLNN